MRKMSLCVICTDPLLISTEDVSNIKPLRCGHILHRECCEKWFVTSNTTQCPLCRKPHSKLTAEAKFFLQFALVDTVRLMSLFFVFYQYYQAFETDTTIYLYMLVDILCGLQFFWPKHDHDMSILSAYMGYYNADKMVHVFYDSYSAQFFISGAISFLQIRIWLPRLAYLVNVALTMLSLLLSTRLTYLTMY